MRRELPSKKLKSLIDKSPVFLLPLLVLGICFLFRRGLISCDSWKVILSFLFSIALALSLLPFRRYLDFRAPTKIKRWLPYFVAGFGFVIYGIYGVIRFLHFANSTWDFGFYDQWLWKISKLQEARGSLWGAHVLADNFPLIVYFIAPIYWVFNHPIALILFEILVVCLGVLPIFWLCRKRFDSDLLPFALGFAYMFYIGNQYALKFTFHPSTLFASLFLFACYFFEEKKYFWHFVFVILALMCKVDVALYIIGYGLFLLLQRHKLGIIHIILGLTWFVVATKMMVSFGGEPRFGLYLSLGKTPFSIIKEIVFHPTHPIALFLENPEKVFVLLTIFASFGFLALLSPSLWPIFLPMLGERFWSANHAHWILFFHYGAPISAVLVLSAIHSILYLKNNIKFPWEFFISIFFIVHTLAMGYFLQAPVHNLIHKSFYQSSEEIRSLRRAIKIIPKTSSLSVQDNLAPHLAHRNNIWVFPIQFEAVDFIFLDIQTIPYPLTEQKYRYYLKQTLENKRYGIRFNEHGVILLQKGLKYNISPTQEVLNYLKEEK